MTENTTYEALLHTDAVDVLPFLLGESADTEGIAKVKYIFPVEAKPNIDKADNWQALAQALNPNDLADGQKKLLTIQESLIRNGKTKDLDMALVCGTMIFPENDDLAKDFRQIMKTEFGEEENLSISARAQRVVEVMAIFKFAGVSGEFGAKHAKLVADRLIQPNTEIDVDELIKKIQLLEISTPGDVVYPATLVNIGVATNGALLIVPSGEKPENRKGEAETAANVRQGQHDFNVQVADDGERVGVILTWKTSDVPRDKDKLEELLRALDPDNWQGVKIKLDDKGNNDFHWIIEKNTGRLYVQVDWTSGIIRVNPYLNKNNINFTDICQAATAVANLALGIDQVPEWPKATWPEVTLRENKNPLMVVEKSGSGLVIRPQHDEFPSPALRKNDIHFSIYEIFSQNGTGLLVNGHATQLRDAAVPFVINITFDDKANKKIPDLDLEGIRVALAGLEGWEGGGIEWGNNAKSSIHINPEQGNDLFFVLWEHSVNSWQLLINNSNSGQTPTDTFNRFCQVASVMANAALGLEPPLEAIKALRPPPPAATVEPEPAPPPADENTEKRPRGSLDDIIRF